MKKLIIKKMSGYDENKDSLYLNYWDVDNLYGWAISQKLTTFRFEQVEDASKFTEDFFKDYDGKSEIGYIFEVDIKYPEIYKNFTWNFYFQA